MQREPVAVDLVHGDLHPEHLGEDVGAHDLRGGAVDDDPAVPHTDDPVAVARGDVDVVEDDDDGAVEVVGGPAQQSHRRRRVAHVEVVERLVEEDEVGVLREDHGDVGPLALTARQLVEEAVAHARQVDVVE